MFQMTAASKCKGCRLKEFIRHLLKLCIIAAFSYFIFAQIWCNLGVIGKRIDQFNWFDFLLSMLLLLLGQFCFNLGWFKIITSNGQKASFRFCNYYWSLSSLGKYVPGRIWQFAGRLLFFEKLGFCKTEIVSYSILEQFYFLLSSLSLVCLFLMMNYDMISKTFLIRGFLVGLILAMGGFIFMHPRALNAACKLASKFIKKVKFTYQMTYKDSLIFFMHFFVGWILIGLGFAFLTKSLITINMKAFLFLVGANSGAYFFGYIVVLAPGGLGAREGAFTYLLNLIFLEGIGAVLSVITRMWYILGELLYLALSFAVTFGIGKKYGDLDSQALLKGHTQAEITEF